MIIKLKKSFQRHGSAKVYGTVRRFPETKAHTVVYHRSRNFRGWVCDCEDFLFRQVAKNRNCAHLQEARKRFGRFGTKVR